MMRLAALLAFLGLTALAALAAQEFYAVLRKPLSEADLALAVAQQTDPQEQSDPPPAPPRRWPALFGQVVVPEPQPPARPEPSAPEPEPAPPKTPVPPVETLGYQIKGVVGDGESRWALVSHPSGEKILRVGDALGEYYTIVLIDAEGIWVESEPGGDRSLLGFVK